MTQHIGTAELRENRIQESNTTRGKAESRGGAFLLSDMFVALYFVCLLDAASGRKHLADRFIGVDPADGFGEEWSDGEDMDTVQSFFGGEWARVGDHQALDGGFAEQFDRGTAKDTVGSSQMDFSSTGFVDQLCSTTNGATGADHVIKHQADFSFDRATNDVLLLGANCVLAMLVDDR